MTQVGHARIPEQPDELDEPDEPLSFAYLLLLLLASVLIVFVAYRFFERSESTTFSIVSKTRVFSLRPICGAKILWDLPPGAVSGASSFQKRAPLDRAYRKAVSLGFGDDAVARVAMDDDGRVAISVRPLAPDVESTSITALVDGRPLKEDKGGFDYVFRTPSKAVGAGGASASERVPLTLRLLGRVVIGDALPEGAGWRKSSVAILDRGHLYGYDRAWRTKERLTLISEPIDPGAVIDTHPDMNRKDSKGHSLIDIRDGKADCASSETSGWPAEGFARGHKDGDLEIVVYRRGRAVGIAPLGGPTMEIGVTWWSAFIASPVVQTGAASFGVLILVLQILTSNRRMLPWGVALKKWRKKILKMKR